MEVTQQTGTDYKTQAENLETQELESPGGIASASVYGHLLAIYLLQNDICNAKFLWKRIPQATKTASPELGYLWLIGQKLWQRDFPGLYECLSRSDWSDTVKPIVQEITELIRSRAFALVASAYSSISTEEFLQFVGLPHAEAIDAAAAKGWQIDKENSMILPVKPIPTEDMSLANDRQLNILTEYVSFLEN